MTSSRLTIELVPKTCWFSNVRSEVSAADWDKLKRLTFKAAGYRCEICGGKGPKWPVECHEVWKYDDELWLQTLERLIALCPACHEVKHIGLAESRGRLPQALRHLADVNRWSIADATTYAESAFEIWARRSNHVWSLDILYLEQLGVGMQTASSGPAKPIFVGSNPTRRSMNPEPLPF